jgi:hypothetical protein
MERRAASSAAADIDELSGDAAWWATLLRDLEARGELTRGDGTRSAVRLDPLQDRGRHPLPGEASSAMVPRDAQVSPVATPAR